MKDMSRNKTEKKDEQGTLKEKKRKERKKENN